jgi:CelD/BcsL family acetyltransferase involved in cellulose biosynthesis
VNPKPPNSVHSGQQLPAERNGNLEEIDLQAWRAFVETDASRMIFHSPEWITFLSEHYRLPLRILALVRDGSILGAVPFLETRTLWQRRKLVSLPFSDVVPVVCRDAGSAELLAQLLRSRAFPAHVSVEIRSPAALPDVSFTEDWVWHTLAVPGDYSEILKGLANAVRRNIRKAESQGLSFVASTSADSMEVFYGLHVRTRKKLGVPVQTSGFFRDMHERVISQGLGFVGLVYHEEKVISSGVFLHWHDTLTYKFGASDPERLEYRPNDYLFAGALRLAVERSFRIFDFGVSRKTELGLRRFKAKWGGRETPVAHCYLKGSPETETGRHVPGFAAAVIRSAPAFVCRGLGALFYRYSQ